MGAGQFLELIILLLAHNINKRLFIILFEGDMVDIEVVAQLVESMESSVNQLEQAIAKKNFDDANKLRTFIFDLHLQINSAITGKK